MMPFGTSPQTNPSASSDIAAWRPHAGAPTCRFHATGSSGEAQWAAAGTGRLFRYVFQVPRVQVHAAAHRAWTGPGTVRGVRKVGNYSCVFGMLY